MLNCPDCGHYVKTEERFCSNYDKRLDIAGNYRESSKLRTTQDVKKIYRTCVFCNGAGKVGEPFGMATPLTHKLCGGTGYNLIPEDWQPYEICRALGKNHIAAASLG
jgi:hypothetical protein